MSKIVTFLKWLRCFINGHSYEHIRYMNGAWNYSISRDGRTATLGNFYYGDTCLKCDKKRGQDGYERNVKIDR